MQQRRGLSAWLGLLCGMVLVVGGLSACSSDSDCEGNDTLSALGESCAATSDCEIGLRCVDLVCVNDDGGDGDADIDAGDPGLTWVAIPAGSFDMGCTAGDESCDDDEIPVRSVDVAAFEMTQTEITQADFEAVMGVNPSDQADCSLCPVENLSRDQAIAFCEAVGGRLPTEAEWEYAARGDATTRFVCGDNPDCLDDAAWYDLDSEDRVHPVGEKQANSYGLYDMSGNVWEFVADCYTLDFEGAPTDGSAVTDAACEDFVARGGGWDFGHWFQRLSCRQGFYSKFRDKNFGFRCVRD